MKKDNILREIEIPEGVSAILENNVLKITGPKGELSREINIFKVNLEVSNNKIIFSSKNPSKNEKRMIGTFVSHVKNMIKGVCDGYIYKLKVSSGHFPISVDIKDKIVEIKNFFGERKPRTAEIIDGAQVSVKNDIIIVTGINKEVVGQTSANIEQATRITNRDRRVFMDRINLISKDEN